MTKTREDLALSKQITEFFELHPDAPRRPRRLSRLLGVAPDDYNAFRETFRALLREGRLGQKGARDQVIGRFVGKDRGFGFVRPEDKGSTPTVDLYIAAGATAGAMTGDLVAVRVFPKNKATSRRPGPEGEIVEIIERHLRFAVGLVERVGGACFLEPDGDDLTTPILLDPAPSPEEVPPGTKVVVEIVGYPEGPGMLPTGAVTEVLGAEGLLETETDAVIRAHGLRHLFPEEALEEAREAVERFDPATAQGRVDLTDRVVITIDPVDARDFDDGISLEPAAAEGALRLGVHIADVSHFVPRDSALDLEARERGTSVYFPRRVLPMLPTALSQGVCALKQDQRRLTISVFLTYDAEALVTRREVCQSVISSSKRLTYEEAQRICDGEDGLCSPAVSALLREATSLAQRIRTRRLARGMLNLDLPEVSLELDPQGRVVDARPTSQEFTHTLIEMFMVEANEAVATLLDEADAPVMRRVHPSPDPSSSELLLRLASRAGHTLSELPPPRRQLQRLIDKTRGRPEGYAINLAMLRSFKQARYSLAPEGHYALASDAYCHFTSPIRRYPDLVVHRMVRRFLLDEGPRTITEEERAELRLLAERCSETERRAEAAEHELRQVLVLQHLADHPGTSFDGVVTGVTSFGLFVQSPRFLIEGLLPREGLGGGWWSVEPEAGRIRDESSGKTFSLGDLLRVTIDRVDVPRRHLDLRLASPAPPPQRDQSGKRRRGKS